MNIILGDCLTELKKIESNTIDLVYLDPPFFTQREHSQKTRDNSKEYRFSDRWESIGDYLKMIRSSLIEIKRVLKNSGSIFLHCDKVASHQLRSILDDVFGDTNFQSEIIWNYKRWSNAKKGLLNSHQNIYFYSKSSDFKFNPIYTDYSATTNVDQILQARARDSKGKSKYKKDEKGNVVLGKEKVGVPLTDVWNIPFLNPKAHERVGYPTQKPLLLLERIIKLTTNEGDTVLDPFCGSGTTLVAAKLLKRNYIGIDISKDAVNLAMERLENPIKTASRLLEEGEQDYIERSEKELAILKILEAIPVQRNNGIDGFLKKYHQGKPVAVRIQREDEELTEAKEKLIESAKSKGCDRTILIRTKVSSSKEGLEQKNLIIIDSLDLHPFLK